MNLNEKVAVITGGASGIGAATTTRQLVEQGAKVAVFDINKDKAEALINELGNYVVFFLVDVTDESSVLSGIEKTIAAFGAIHICINYAGVADAVKTVGN